MEHTLQKGAVFIADAHCAPYRQDLISLLKYLDCHLPPQLVLMGDMFDVLVGSHKASLDMNAEAVELICTLSQKTELFYFEGNHDYGLKPIFPHAHVFSRNEQPVVMAYEGKRVALSHGDVMIGQAHELYMRTICNQSVIKAIIFLNGILQGRIWKKLNGWLERKKICYPFEGFETLAQRRIAACQSCGDFDLLIEGHYHQDRSFAQDGWLYCNLGAHACNQSYYVLESTTNETVLQKAILKEY